MTKVAMITLGCPKNQVDAERMLALLTEGGFEVAVPEEADVAVVNTCGFIEDAKKEAIEAILEMADLKAQGRLRGIVVTGCLAQRYRADIRTELPEVNVVLGAGSHGDICEAVAAAAAGESLERYAPIEEADMGGGRVLTTPFYTAYLKLGDGCDNRCTYCAIPLIRGRMRSRRMEELVAEAKELAGAGVKELILVAQDSTRYGEDLYGENKLALLISKLEEIRGIAWIRLLYGYPDRISDELLAHMAKSEKLLHYIDLPLQHASDVVLRRMNRRGSRADIEETLARIRATVPDVCLRTTFIAGFPGETEEDFAQLEDFVKTQKFDRVGCFAYSAEEGTPAAGFAEQISEELKTARVERLMRAQSDISEEKNKAFVGKTLTVLVEEAGCGRSRRDAPEIDGQVYFTGKAKPGDMVKAKILRADAYDLYGAIE
ncbi:MAG TPA: 30S ribosomal protein S12 methylthiotransferase RimO [Candidatus Acidoferrum sp.]|nr:30S ribosomal protein S12 methylthiotransferase RimO [Candidatus Acidoferrum sp.]